MSRGKKIEKKSDIARVDNGDGGFNAWCFTGVDGRSSCIRR